MAEQTTNLGLTKPDAAEGYNINVFNNNADIVDGAVGALLNELGGNGGGLGDKVDTLLDNVAAVKTDTAALVQALETANANIATLLTQTSGVKSIVNGQVTTPSDGNVSFAIPNTMNADKVVIIVDYLATPNSTMHGVSWVRNGYTVNAKGQSGTVITYQLIEFN